MRFEISPQSNWMKWNFHQSEFQFVPSHVNTYNEVALHRSEVLFQSETLNWLEFTSGLMQKCSKLYSFNYGQGSKNI